MAKERWIWGCDYDNHSSAWDDREICRAKSIKTFPTEEEARKALTSHVRKSWHPEYVGCYGSVRGHSGNSRKCGYVHQLKKYARFKSKRGWKTW